MISPELLRRFPFFADFSPEELKRLAMLGEEQPLSTGQLLFTEGEHVDRLYFLIEGEVDIMLTLGEREVVPTPLSTVPSGDVLGWSALIEPHLYTASAQATRPGRVVAFDGSALARDAAATPHFYGTFMKKLAQTISTRLKDTRTQLLSLVVQPTP